MLFLYTREIHKTLFTTPLTYIEYNIRSGTSNISISFSYIAEVHIITVFVSIKGSDD